MNDSLIKTRSKKFPVISDAKFHHLEQTAGEVIGFLKEIKEVKNSSIAIIGGLAV